MIENTQIFKGCLKRWNDEKGFGFIMPEVADKDVFIHISALKTMSRRPVVGDIIYYQLQTDQKGKTKAVNAQIEGVATQSTIKPKQSTNINVSVHSEKKNNWLLQSLAILLLIIAAAILYQWLPNNATPPPVVSPASPITPPVATPTQAAPTYRCSGKQHCSEMTSCAEARFYLQYCPNTKLDGDGDGIPCESQWCN